MEHIIAIIVFATNAVVFLTGHGYMIEPAARNCMWRAGFDNPINYDDNALDCGGFYIQWYKNNGKCGVCGDSSSLDVQPDNDGGKYGNGIIAKVYTKGEIINVTIVLTKSHLGSFQFRIGEFDNTTTKGDSMGKLKGVLMEFVGGGTKFTKVVATQTYRFQLHLPANLTCTRCVIQWWYRCGNNWGCDPDGTCGKGHGIQENFVNCADVQINS